MYSLLKILLLLIVTGLTASVYSAFSENNDNTYECYIGKYQYINNLQFFGSGGFAFIGYNNFFYSPPEYTLVINGKEIGKYGELFGLQASPDGSSWAAIGNFISRNNQEFNIIKDGKILTNISYYTLQKRIPYLYYYDKTSDIPRNTLFKSNPGLFKYSPDSKHFAFIDRLNWDSDKEYVQVDNNKILENKIKIEKVGTLRGKTYTKYKFLGVYNEINSLSFSKNSQDILYEGKGEVFGYYIDDDTEKDVGLSLSEMNDLGINREKESVYDCLKNGKIISSDSKPCLFTGSSNIFPENYEVTIHAYSGIMDDLFYGQSIEEKYQSPLICKGKENSIYEKYFNILVLNLKLNPFYVLILLYLLMAIFAGIGVTYFQRKIAQLNYLFLILLGIILLIILGSLLEFLLNHIRLIFITYFPGISGVFIFVILILAIPFLILPLIINLIASKPKRNNTIKDVSDNTHQNSIALEHKKMLEEKYKKEQDEKIQQEILRRRSLLVTDGYINTFLLHAERKYQKRDKYGNLDKEALNKEILDYLRMIANMCGHKNQIPAIEALSRGYSYPKLNEDYIWLKGYLKQVFEKYIEEKNKKNQQGVVNINEMTGIEFERYLAKKFEKNGYQIEFTPQSGDQGADIIATKGIRRLVIQAKRYKATVGNGAVQEVIGAIRYYNGTEGWVITNSIFTNSARELANINNIRLIDGSDLLNIDRII